MNQKTLSQLKQDLLNPLTDLQEVLLVFYISPNQQLWHTLAYEACSNIYFIKRTPTIEKLFNKLFVWDINANFISSIIMKITIYADGSDFNYQFITPMYLTPNYPCGNSVQEFIDLFIDKIDGKIVKL
jgi:hypothetical protein